MAVRNVPVTSDSGHVEAVSYDDDTQDLVVVFRGGRSYVYHGVPSNEVEALSRADSAGKYINNFIKPLYEVERV